MYGKFCPEGGLTNPKCYKIESIDYASEEQILDILLDILKSELPPRLQVLKDCNDKPMYIAEEAIDIIPLGAQAHLSLILNPLGDVPSYSESLLFRTVRYNFELILTVENQVPACITWELMRFKNAVEGLIVGAEFYIDGYSSVVVEPVGFTYYIPEPLDSGSVRRQGTYRFSVTVTQNKLIKGKDTKL